MLFGLYFFSFTIGSLASMLSSIDKKESNLLTKLSIIDQFAKEADLSKILRVRLHRAIRYSSGVKGHSFSEKQDILK